MRDWTHMTSLYCKTTHCLQSNCQLSVIVGCSKEQLCVTTMLVQPVSCVHIKLGKTANLNNEMLTCYHDWKIQLLNIEDTNIFLNSQLMVGEMRFWTPTVDNAVVENLLQNTPTMASQFNTRPPSTGAIARRHASNPHGACIRGMVLELLIWRASIFRYAHILTHRSPQSQQ